jgi:hypothetical protein
LYLLKLVAEKSSLFIVLSLPFTAICSALQYAANRATTCFANTLGQRCGLFGAAAFSSPSLAKVARAASTDFRAISCSTAGRN